ncbi:hypothetical protein DSM106972_056550 [Dulcicalothrix desertica PCC 7102]|uniref:Uncharacterized protein n=1 Tax=Dulcicalothrix desertica PCC 7102 TaxID=232991 RepID=A0A3S1CJE1_9CYAN|nr:hypothetical protein [Dulcicalothrix desertica]RUT02735.1 hypothetical protein DSM106972_056550 [Dulcicalothrix desertica PCC 7102]TWH39030.1 hypothetical protein CAL7102_08234 [Dulcicalothrix desertica PCC 7102]
MDISKNITELVFVGFIETIDSPLVIWSEERFIEHQQNNPDWLPLETSRIVHQISPEILAKMQR